MNRRLRRRMKARGARVKCMIEYNRGGNATLRPRRFSRTYIPASTYAPLVNSHVLRQPHRRPSGNPARVKNFRGERVPSGSARSADNSELDWNVQYTRNSSFMYHVFFARFLYATGNSSWMHYAAGRRWKCFPARRKMAACKIKLERK